MRTLLLIISVLFFTTLSVYSQSRESDASTQQEIDKKLSVKDPTDTLKLPSTDSLTITRKLDSLQQKLAGPNRSVPATDSLTGILSKPVTEVNKRRDQFQHQIDSLGDKASQPVERLNKGVSSMQDKAERKGNSVNEKIDQRSQQLQQKAQQGVTRATAGEVSLPGKDLKTGESGIASPLQTEGVPNVDLPDQNLPGIGNVPEPELPSGNTASLKLPDENLNLDHLKEKGIPETDKINDVTSEIKSIDSKLAEVEKYEAELQQIKNNELPATDQVAKQAEEKVANLDQVKAVSEETKKLTKLQAEQEALLQRYRDKKLLQQEIERKAKSVVNDKLNQFSPAFKEAQSTIAKAKKANPTVQSFKDMTKKRPNPMAGKPLRERLVPGITLQVYTNDVFMIDWGAQLGYKVTGRLSFGAGGAYRMAISEDYTTWVKGGGVYGYRAYTQFGLIKSFYLHGEYESLHLSSNAFTTQPTEENLNRVHSGYFGIGKRYDISRKIRGSVIVLYRAEFKGDLPSMSKINLRVGFDLNMKKEKRLR